MNPKHVAIGLLAAVATAGAAALTLNGGIPLSGPTPNDAAMPTLGDWINGTHLDARLSAFVEDGGNATLRFDLAQTDGSPREVAVYLPTKHVTYRVPANVSEWEITLPLTNAFTTRNAPDRVVTLSVEVIERTAPNRSRGFSPDTVYEWAAP